MTTQAGRNALDVIERLMIRSAMEVSAAVESGTFNHIEKPRASEWVCQWELQRRGVRRSTIKRLLKDGLIESRVVDGFGSEIRRTDWEEIATIGTTCFICGDAAIPSTHYVSPRCDRHRDVS